jgi:hypothetical protein
VTGNWLNVSLLNAYLLNKMNNVLVASYFRMVNFP